MHTQHAIECGAHFVAHGGQERFAAARSVERAHVGFGQFHWLLAIGDTGDTGGGGSALYWRCRAASQIAHCRARASKVLIVSNNRTISAP